MMNSFQGRNTVGAGGGAEGKRGNSEPARQGRMDCGDARLSFDSGQ